MLHTPAHVHAYTNIIYTYIHIDIILCTCMGMYMCKGTHAHVHMHIHVNIHWQTQTDSTYTLYTHTCMYANTYWQQIDRPTGKLADRHTQIALNCTKSDTKARWHWATHHIALHDTTLQYIQIWLVWLVWLCDYAWLCTIEVMVFVNQVSEIVHGVSAFHPESEIDCGLFGQKDSTREARWSKVFVTHTTARPTR